MDVNGAAKISLVGAWTETALWGINTVVFAAVCWVLFKKSGSKRNRWILGTTSSFLYLLASVNVAATLRQLLEAFIYVPSTAVAEAAQPGAPPYASLYYSTLTNPMSLLKDIVYVLTVFTQNLVLIWRLYVVWGGNWKLVLLPLIFALAQGAVAFAGAIGEAKPGANPFSTVEHSLGLTGWSLDIAINVSVTVAIAARLLYSSRKLLIISDDTTGIRKTYVTAMVTIIESGAMYAAVSVVLLALYVGGSPVALPAISVATQLAVLVPMFIIVRVGLGLTHGLPLPQRPYADSYGRQSATYSLGALGASRQKPVNMDGRIAVHREVIRSELTLERASDIALSDYKATNNSQLCVDSPV